MTKKIHPQEMMMMAIIYNDPDALKRALVLGADWELTQDGKPGDYAEDKANSPWWFNAAQMSLHKMCSHGKTDCVWLLQEQGVDFTQAAEQLIYPDNLVNRLSPHHSGDALGVVLDMWPEKWGPWQDWRQADTGFSLLHMFAKETQGKKIQTLLEAGADPNTVDRLGRTPLHLAKKAETVYFLLEAGADPLLLDKTGCSPLYAALKQFRGAYRKEKDRPSPSIVVKFAPFYSLALDGGILADPKANTIAKSVKDLMTDEFINRTKSVYDLDKITHQIDTIFSEMRAKELNKLSNKIRAGRAFNRRLRQAGELDAGNQTRPVPKF